MQIWFSGRGEQGDKSAGSVELPPPRPNRTERNLIVAAERADAIEDALKRMEEDIRKIREERRRAGY